jgi:Tfp pilus assembly protein PilN
MLQQINLYQDEFKKIDPPYSANTMLLLAFGSIMVGVIISTILATLMWWWQSELTGNKKDGDIWQVNLQKAILEFPAPQEDARLVRNMVDLKLGIDRNKKVLKHLHTQQLNAEHQSFSVLLLALTWVTEKDLWLTNIKITKGGASLSLQGRALNAEALPNYLKKLSEIEIFTDLKFRVFEMTREKKELSFVVSSDREIQDLKGVMDLLDQK